MRQLLSSLITHGKITTTEARAKALKRETERLISRSKRLDLTTRRRILALLPERSAAHRFLEQIVPQFKDRVGGYVRVVKLPPRRGDNAPMARIEFVEEIKEPAAPPKKEKPAAKTKPAPAKKKAPPRKAAAKKAPAKKRTSRAKKK